MNRHAKSRAPWLAAWIAVFAAGRALAGAGAALEVPPVPPSGPVEAVPQKTGPSGAAAAAVSGGFDVSACNVPPGTQLGGLGPLTNCVNAQVTQLNGAVGALLQGDWQGWAAASSNYWALVGQWISQSMAWLSLSIANIFSPQSAAKTTAQAQTAADGKFLGAGAGRSR